MTRFGYTLMTEQSGPKDLVRYAVSAERAGFDFEVSSDHYFPWLSSQGHAPYAWSVLGAVAYVTERVELFTYVTCPTMRYHRSWFVSRSEFCSVAARTVLAAAGGCSPVNRVASCAAGGPELPCLPTVVAMTVKPVRRCARHGPLSEAGSCRPTPEHQPETTSTDRGRP